MFEVHCPRCHRLNKNRWLSKLGSLARVWISLQDLQTCNLAREEQLIAWRTARPLTVIEAQAPCSAGLLVLALVTCHHSYISTTELETSCTKEVSVPIVLWYVWLLVCLMRSSFVCLGGIFFSSRYLCLSSSGFCLSARWSFVSPVAGLLSV